MVELRGDTLTFSFPEIHKDAVCSVSFQRTLRIPDDDREHFLPPGLGKFPLHHVDDHADRLPDQWRTHGGVLMPMYQAEALWICFEQRHDGYPMAIRVAAGKIDALTGKSFDGALHPEPQNYLVAPHQPWLDGFCVEKGLVRQFVAMPLGQGYTAEEQLTGAAEHGGLQIVAHPMTAARYERLVQERREDRLRRPVVYYSMALESPGMGLAPGGRMRQEVYEDQYGLDAWTRDARARCFVHLLNSAQYREATGYAPPHEPPTATEYTQAGLPWFDYYDTDRKALEGAPRLAGLDSVASRKKKIGEPPLDAGSPVAPAPGQVKRLRPFPRPRPRPGTVREGAF